MAKLDAARRGAMIETLRVRFEENPSRHEGIYWSEVQAKLEAQGQKLWSLAEMERTGGEPDVAGLDACE